jgi:hypothetical protein
MGKNDLNIFSDNYFNLLEQDEDQFVLNKLDFFNRMSFFE